MTKALRKAIATRSRLENRAYKSKSDIDLRAYKRQKNYCSRLYKRERKKFYSNLDVRSITDNKRFWKTMKPFFTNKGIIKSKITLIDDDRIIHDDSEVAQTLGDFFSNAVSSLNIGVPSEYVGQSLVSLDDPIDDIIAKYSQHPSIKLINENVNKGSFNFQTIASEDVVKEINALNQKKASMSSSIPAKFLKEYKNVCSEPLKKVINNGITTSIFNEGLKVADLTPVFKDGDTTSKKNYRNISLLPSPSKIFEKIMQGQISGYVNEFLSPFLCGYRKGYSAQHALSYMLEKWRISVDKGGYGGGILMDLSKAFDTLDHDLLIAKLHAYGFEKSALQLIKSYLCGRWQRTKINSSYSTWSELLSGVPQGSVLGPLLFNLFINDLFFIVKTDICNYADDSTPYVTDMKLETLMEKLECAASTAVEWFRYNGMKLNSSKCHLIVCGHKFEHMLTKIDNSLIIESFQVKLLGIEINSKLTLENHMLNICKKASQKLNALSRVCAFLPFYRRKMLMQAFFNAQFGYSPLVWMCHSRKINTKINKLHYRALRMIYLDEISTFEELLKKDGSVTIHHRNLQFLVTEMFKVIHGLSPPFMSELFGYENERIRDTRSNTMFDGNPWDDCSPTTLANFYNNYNPKSVNNGAETLRNLGPKLWNIVPHNLKGITSLPLFKKKIKSWIPLKCPCRICRLYISQVGYLN